MAYILSVYYSMRKVPVVALRSRHQGLVDDWSELSDTLAVYSSNEIMVSRANLKEEVWWLTVGTMSCPSKQPLRE